MVFNSNKGFFLTLDDSAAPATLELPEQEAPASEEAPVEAAVNAADAGAKPEAPSKPSPAANPSATEAVSEVKAEPSSQPAASLTTAEAIAAELAAAEAARPAVTYSTFAPSNLMQEADFANAAVAPAPLSKPSGALLRTCSRAE